MKYFLNIEHKSKEYLAVRLNMPAGAKGVQTLYQDGLPEGIIIRGEAAHPWKTNGWKTIDDELYLYGENLKGTELQEILTMAPKTQFAFLHRLQSALSVAEKTGAVLPPVSMRSILFLEDGGILFIPKRIAEAIHTYMDPDQASREVELFAHPAADQNYMRMSFALCSLLYTFLCGRNPFPVHQSVERTNALSYTPLIPIRYFQPRISSTSDSKILAALKKPQEASLKPEELDKIFQNIEVQLRDSDLHFPPETSEKIDQMTKKNLFIQHSRSVLDIHKSKLTIAAVALAIIALLSTLGNPGSDEKADFSSMAPAEIVELYYDGFNTLDHTTMEEITARNVGRGDIREVMFLYVTTRVQTAYSHSENIVRPSEYQQGLIPLASQTVYGISDLSILPDSSDSDVQRFIVSYMKWAPHTRNDEDTDFEASLLSAPEVERIIREDSVTLELIDGRYIITEITRLSEEELPVLIIEAPKE